jgi:nitrate reductase gamma subunit
MSDRALFAIAPYVAALIFLLATLTRISRERQLRRQPRERLTDADANAADVGNEIGSETAARRELFRGHRVSAIALLAVLAVHLATWIVPGLLLAWNQSVTRIVATEGTLFVLGLAAGVGLVRVIVSRLREPSVTQRMPALTRVADMMLLGVLAVAVASGLAMAARYRWASSWSAVTLTPYVRSLLALEPNVQLLALPYLIKLHVFSGIALLAVLPFTSLMHRVLIPIHRLLDRLTTPAAAFVARQSKRASAWANESGRALVWPEEED